MDRYGLGRGLARAAVLAMVIAAFVFAPQASASTSQKEDQNRAHVTVAVQPAPAVAGSVAYLVTARNIGSGPAKNATVTMPFDGQALRVVDLVPSRAGIWVSNRSGSTVEVQTGRLNSGGDVASFTVRFEVLGEGARLTERARYGWSDGKNGGNGLSNLPSVGDPQRAPLTVAPGADVVTLSSDVFIPGEPVIFWYTTPAGVTVETEVDGGRLVDANTTDTDKNGGAFVTADANGQAQATIRRANLGRGTYVFAARGNWSTFLAQGTITLP